MRSPRVNFQLAFYGSNRKAAQAAADKDFRGNLTAFLNWLIEQDHKRRNEKDRKKR